jgi:uncharacterized membrane protein
MAGIGFRLEKILSKNSYIHLFKAYAYSAIISAGPVLFTILSIAILSLLSLTHIDLQEIMIFRTMVVYIYGVSLIISSPIQMIITRYLADRMFVKDFRAVIPAFIGVIVLSILFHAGLGYVALERLDLGFGITITAVVLFVSVGIIWIAMIVLSAAKEFQWIVKSFMYGSLLSMLAGYFLGINYGLLGLITGFTMGQVLIVILLIVQVFTEFEYRTRVEYYFLEYFKRYTSLAFISFLYNIGIWADKFVFWLSPETHQQIHGYLHASAIYDTPVFMAYLFIIPSLAMFTIRVETSFYVHYKKFYLSILNKHPLSAIEERYQNIISDLKISMGRMIVMQGTITVVGLVLSPVIYEHMSMSSTNLAVFQIVILATFLQALLHTLLIITLYFDFRMDALVLSLVFAASNIIFSRLSIVWGFNFYGYGYFASCLLSLIVGLVIFNYRMKHLLYHTFVGQKIVVHKDVVPEGVV